MKYKHLFWGIILIAVGLLFILANFGVIHFNWFSFWRLWPVILILWGISVLPMRDLFKFISLIAVVLITFLVINRLPDTKPWFWKWHHDGSNFHFDFDEDDNDTTAYYHKDQNLTVPFDSLSTKGKLILEAAAGNFKIDSSTSDYLSFSKTGDIGNYELTTDNRTGTKEVSLKMQDGTTHRKMNTNQVNIRLNEKPSWNLDLDIGAAAMTMDLSKYKIDTVEIDAGAASVEMTLGKLNPKTVVTVSAGASSFTLRVPKEAGCQVRSESFLVSKDFEGFVKKADRTYETPNWYSGKSRIYITVETAISSIKIERY